MDDATTWKLIHEERVGTAAMLASLTPEQWAAPTLCAGWHPGHGGAHRAGGRADTRLVPEGHGGQRVPVHHHDRPGGPPGGRPAAVRDRRAPGHPPTAGPVPRARPRSPAGAARH